MILSGVAASLDVSVTAVIALFVLIATGLQVWTTAMDLQDNHRIGISGSSAAAELRKTVCVRSAGSAAAARFGSAQPTPGGVAGVLAG